MGIAAQVIASRRRTGSYPLMNLAEDFGVDYGDVLLLSVTAGGASFTGLPDGRRAQIAAASRRVWMRLGDSTSYVLYSKIKEAVTR